MSATITNLRIADQALAFTLTVTGDAGGFAEPMMYVYDAAGSERERTNLGRMEVGQTWEALLDLPATTVGDGDFGAWIDVLTTAADGQMGPLAREGIGFLVGRGRVYPSREHVDDRTFDTPPTLSPLRLEGTWIVFDMTSTAQHDVEVIHQLAVGIENSGNFQSFHGQELLRAGATQQAHYLLPDQLADGKYIVSVTAKNEGSDFPAAGYAEFQVNGGVITLL